MRKNLNYYKGKNVSKHIIFFIVFALIVNFVTVFALSEHGSGSECFQFDLDTNEFPVTSVTINGYEWNKSDDHRYYSNENKFTIVVIAGKKGEDYPWISTSGGLDDYKKYTAIDNPDDDPGVEGDEYLLTLVLDNVPYEGCNSMGMSIEAGPFPVYDIQDATSDITITISGDELEYHYVADKPDEPDVSRFKFSINEKHSDALVPFTFGNANYTYNDNPAPNNVTSVTTINPIHYTYKYDGTGFVSFFVNAAASDEYTKIEINGVDYSNQAPHTQSEVFEHLEGRASQFEIKNVPYNASGYNVVVEGRRLPDEKQVGSFGWSYKRESEPSYDPNEDSIFAHGRLEFVQVKYTDIDNVSHVFDSVSEYNNARFHGTGEIYQWKDGNKDYQDLANAWGEALVPYGAELTFRIVPDEGYQLVGLANGSDYFEATNEVGVYKVTFNTEAMGKGASNFHLGAVFTEVGNEVKTDSNKIRNGNININQNVENGNLKLEINDTNVSGESRTEFENRAASDGYTVENYLDLSLYNSIYKGGKVDQNGNYESWDTPIENINSNANVTLELSDNMEGKEVAVIHEVHDGNNIVGYDLLETSYNSSDNTISFETNSFSNYAIVVKDLNNDNNNNNNNPQEMVTVSFNTTGGSTIAPIDVQKGDLVPRPKDPTKENMKFEDWYSDEAFHDKFDFNTPIDKDIVLYANWEEVKNTEKYTVKDENGNEIIFTDESGHGFHLNVIDYLSYSKEDVMAMGGITSEEYDQVFDGLRAGVKKHGELISFYEIEVYDEDDHYISEPLTGKFKIRIKITPEMKKYNTFKLLFVADDFSMGSPITLTKNGDYLEGTLEHLSKYALAGSVSKSSNPQTGDNINKWIIISLISILGLSIGVISIRKMDNKND